jgi:hypothetical protein
MSVDCCSEGWTMLLVQSCVARMYFGTSYFTTPTFMNSFARCFHVRQRTSRANTFVLSFFCSCTWCSCAQIMRDRKPIEPELERNINHELYGWRWYNRQAGRHMPKLSEWDIYYFKLSLLPICIHIKPFFPCFDPDKWFFSVVHLWVSHAASTGRECVPAGGLVI